LKNLSGNSISRVWRDGNWIYKQQIKYLTENEIWCLNALSYTVYVPRAERLDDELIRMEYIEQEPITNPELFIDHCNRFLEELGRVGIVHGDLTRYAVLPRANIPVVIDWAESRMACDPRAPKRPGNDGSWLMDTAMEFINERKST